MHIWTNQRRVKKVNPKKKRETNSGKRRKKYNDGRRHITYDGVW